MSAGKGPLRFRRAHYGKGNFSTEPRWHRAAGDYKKSEVWKLEALCGYEMTPSMVLKIGFQLSSATKPRASQLCKKCELAAAKAALKSIGKSKEEGENV